MDLLYMSYIHHTNQWKLYGSNRRTYTRRNHHTHDYADISWTVGYIVGKVKTEFEYICLCAMCHAPTVCKVGDDINA